VDRGFLDVYFEGIDLLHDVENGISGHVDFNSE
jgi:hypothetical protein